MSCSTVCTVILFSVFSSESLLHPEITNTKSSIAIESIFIGTRRYWLRHRREGIGRRCGDDQCRAVAGRQNPGWRSNRWGQARADGFQNERQCHWGCPEIDKPV